MSTICLPPDMWRLDKGEGYWSLSTKAMRRPDGSLVRCWQRIPPISLERRDTLGDT